MRARKPKNAAGLMGKIATQPITGMSMSMNIDPMERMMQRFDGRLKGGKRSKKKKTMMQGGY
jgi:hypothetical protein|tara:strand:+ start:281 stop:466 length:186 start_codon:yes stop_codon:yes gene_type:complete